VSYDDWKLATPPEYEYEDDPARCPHGEDRPDDCEACNLGDEPHDDGPCPHRYNGDTCDLCGAEHPQSLREFIEERT
jgi:hypothetical protein